MKRQILFLILVTFLITPAVQAQPNSPSHFTGVYQALIDPSVEFIVKQQDQQLILEIPGQGQANMVSDGDNRYHFREIPVTLQYQFDPGGKATGFQWTQNVKGQPAEWIRVSGADTGMTGHYRLRSDPYKSIYIQEQGGGLTTRVNEGPAVPMVASEGKYRAQLGDYIIWYEFVKDKSGHFKKITTREGGTLQFTRVKDYNVALDGGFLRPDGFTRADTLRGMLTPLRTCYDVRFYALDVEVLPYQKFIKGRNSIHFKAVESFDRMQIDLYENMKIDKIVYQDQELPFTRSFNAVFIQFPATILKDAEASVTVYYEGKPIIPNITALKGGFLWYKDRDGNPWIESVCQGSGASLWWPCKDHLSDEPDSMKISVTIPDDLINISNGRLLDTVSLPGNRKRFDWFVSYPINNYNVVVNIGNYKHASEVFHREKDSMQLHYYYLPYNQEPARKIFGRTKEWLSFLERSFGEYPFKKDNFTLMESLYPMEHQGAISIGSINDPFYSDKINYKESARVMWHEAAHEWWGNNVTAKDIADIWIHEAFATYAEVMITEFFEGREAAQQLLRTQIPGNKEPVIGAYDVNNFRLGDVYPKGCLMLHTLRNIIDDDSTWLSLLQGIQQQFRYQTVTTNDIISYVNHALKKDFTPFFDQYLRHTAIPALQLAIKETGNDLDVQYRWKTDVKGFAMPVKVTTGNEEFDFIYPDSEWKSIRVKGMKQKQFKVDTMGFLVRVVME